jgi:hypothetical protein
MSMYGGGNSSDQGLQWAKATASATLATSAAATASLPGTAVGSPKKLRAYGTVSGDVTINIGNTQQIIVPINPNAPFTEVAVPAAAFPNKVNGVAIVLNQYGSGTVGALVGFSP